MLRETKQKVLQKWQWKTSAAFPLPVHVPTCVPWVRVVECSLSSSQLHPCRSRAQKWFQEDCLCCDFGCADRPPDLVSYRGTCCLPSKEDGGANDLQSPAPTTVSMILIQWDCQWTWGWLSSSSLCCWHLELLKICTFLPTGLSIISHVWFLTQTLFRLSFFSEKWLQSSRSLVLSI